jgi:hypothetical protein
MRSFVRDYSIRDPIICLIFAALARQFLIDTGIRFLTIVDYSFNKLVTCLGLQLLLPKRRHESEKRPVHTLFLISIGFSRRRKGLISCLSRFLKHRQEMCTFQTTTSAKQKENKTEKSNPIDKRPQQRQTTITIPNNTELSVCLFSSDKTFSIRANESFGH